MNRLTQFIVFTLVVFLFGCRQSNVAIDYKKQDPLIFVDPRSEMLYKHVEKGEEVKNISAINNSLLIICWWPAPNQSMGGGPVWQISGIEGFHSIARTQKFLEKFYEEPIPSGQFSPDLIIAYNQWGSYLQIRETAVALSKKYSFDVYRAGGRGFNKANLAIELPGRLKLIQNAFTQSAASE